MDFLSVGNLERSGAAAAHDATGCLGIKYTANIVYYRPLGTQGRKVGSATRMSLFVKYTPLRGSLCGILTCRKVWE